MSVRVLFLAAMIGLSAFAQTKPGEWQSLFDGKSLEGHAAQFKGHGPVRVESGNIVLGAGNQMTGLTWNGAFPKTNYEIRFEAARLQGNDFFASLTFPVGESFCTWVTGGWGGDVVRYFQHRRLGCCRQRNPDLFHLRDRTLVPLETAGIRRPGLAWIDDKQVIKVAIAGRKIGLRFGDMRACSAPLGFASYLTAGGIRSQYRVVGQ